MTGTLNTLDDNWERGEANYFVGSQLGNCEDMTLNESVNVHLIHSGSDGLKLARVTLFDSVPTKIKFECPVGVKLDNSETFVAECIGIPVNDAPVCNGHTDFCSLPFDRATFGGSHNAGTGLAKRPLDCFFKNQDLNIMEQLDLGIRFFDIDVIYRWGKAK